MRLRKIRFKKAERPNWALPFFAGMAAGIVGCSLWFSEKASVTGWQDLTALSRLAYMEINSVRFFWYVMPRRLGTVWFLSLLSTTFVGVVALYFYVFWLGISGGVLASAFVSEYGIKGILLFGASLTPQIFFYVPAALMLLSWGLQVCMKLYYPSGFCGRFLRGGGEGGLEGIRGPGLLARFLWIQGVVIIGALFESYVNPNIVTKLLNIF